MTDQELREQAEVMLAYANAPEGKKPKLEWQNPLTGAWHLQDEVRLGACNSHKYRLARSPIAPGHNPDKLTVDKIPDGYRLMTWDEVLLGVKHSAVGLRGESGILAYDQVNGRWMSGSYWGTSDTNTYCVPIDWKDPLAPKKLIRKPCGPEHFPPGTVVRTKGQNQWQLVVGCQEDGICGICDSGYAVINGFAHFVSTTERSLDGGKTWLPCYVEVEE